MHAAHYVTFSRILIKITHILQHLMGLNMVCYEVYTLYTDIPKSFEKAQCIIIQIK